jgi:hypothetical protein
MALLLGLPGAAVAAPPTNDSSASPIAVTGPLPYSNSQDTTDATPATTDPDCGGGPTVWYSYEPSQDLRVRADTFGSDYDTTLWVGTGSTEPDTIDCNDDAGYEVQSAVTFDAVSGTTYYFMVGACCGEPDASGGNLVFNVDEAPPPPEIEIAIDPTASANRKTGTVTVTGTADCANGDYVYIYGEIRQRAGRQYITGYFETWIDGCSQGMTWTAEGQADGVFAGGKATVEAYGETCNEYDCAYDEATRTVKMRNV